MTHGNCVSYLNSAVFADTVVPSGCHRTIIRWLHDGIARVSHSRVAFRRESGSLLFPSYCLREVINARWHRWSLEVITKMTRFDKMPSLWPYEGQNGHTNTTRKWTIARSSGNLLARQRFCHRSRSCCRSMKNPPAATRLLHMPSWMARYGPMCLRSEPNLEFSFIVCPSYVIFGTVWPGHELHTFSCLRRHRGPISM